MARRSDRRRRWASLSALAGAALAASGGSSEAAIIFHSAHGIGPDAILPLPGNNISVFKSRSGGFFDGTVVGRTYSGPKGRPKTFVTRFFGTTTSGGAVRARGVSFRRRGFGFNASIALAKKGQTFNQVGSGAGSSGRVANWDSLQQSAFGRVRYQYGPRPNRFPRTIPGFSSYSNNTVRKKFRVGVTRSAASGLSYYQYVQRTAYDFPGLGKQFALFRFDVGSQTDYGWLELALGNPGGSAPFTRLIGYAYDTTGKPIPAGAVPEPEHLPLALGALALGAIGVREWRRKRNATA